jgi:hypothetical protein
LERGFCGGLLYRPLPRCLIMGEHLIGCLIPLREAKLH